MKVAMMLASVAMAIAGAVPACATEGGRVQDGFFSYDFDQDLKAILDPSPLEAPSLQPMWPRVTLPALSTAQVEKAVRGNTIRRNDDAAVYFAPDGTLEAWINDWSAVADARCPAADKPGDAFRRRAGKCEEKKTIPTTGSWQARNNAVCVELRMPGETEKQCWYLAVVTDRIALFDDSGDMLGALKLLKPGRVLDQIGD